MPSLSIRDFSCIKSADFTLKPINVIIGAQGSGKSVTIKLFYFFSELIVNHIDFAETGLSFEEYTGKIATKFDNWFPQSTWGNKDFCIEYKLGSHEDAYFNVKITFGNGMLKIAFSEWFQQAYIRSSQMLADVQNNTATMLNQESARSHFRVRNFAQEITSVELGHEYITDQILIPAARSIFTSMEDILPNLYRILESDSPTLKFSQLFTLAKRRHIGRPAQHVIGWLSEQHLKTDWFMQKLFEGEIQIEKEREFIKTSDGRIIPLNLLSSGHQELFPIWTIVNYLTDPHEFFKKTKNLPDFQKNNFLYIEEPEAHLFPSAQSSLMEFLVGSMSALNHKTKLVLTTHSPYIMSKLNVFLKAGEIAKDESKREAVRKIVPEECWLTTEQIGAYCIEDGVLLNIVNAEDGLVDSTYLDQISEDLSKDFEELLNIEFETE
jgi:AAA15 family ATPase/GTPase